MSTLSDVSQSNVGWIYPSTPYAVDTEGTSGLISGITRLVSGQAYVDVSFGVAQPDNNWIFTGCGISNTADVTPENIAPGLISSKTTAGFRLNLSGLPDSSNYFLNWEIKGVAQGGTEATTYQISGPSSGHISAPSSFVVELPAGTSVSAPVVITPSSGGGGGSFSPTSVTLTPLVSSAIFTYTPASYGAKTISVTNSGALSNPASVAFTSTAATYTLGGPSGGEVGVASTDFTVALPASGVVIGTVTVTPSDGGAGGTFTPTTATLTTVAPSDTFTYTPSSVGSKTISVTNDGGLTNPANLSYLASSGLADGDPVSNWDDDSGNGNDATQSGSARPTFKTNIVNSLPVVRFDAASSTFMELTTPITGAAPRTTIVVAKVDNTKQMSVLMSSGENVSAGNISDGGCSFTNQTHVRYSGTDFADGAFHVFSFKDSGGGFGTIRSDGGADNFLGQAANVFSEDLEQICRAADTCDIAEIVIYDSSLGATDENNLIKYLGDKYGITVGGGGSAVDPSTVTGLQGWWAADSLGS